MIYASANVIKTHEKTTIFLGISTDSKNPLKKDRSPLLHFTVSGIETVIFTPPRVDFFAFEFFISFFR
jgi:hypothetical protein